MPVVAQPDGVVLASNSYLGEQVISGNDGSQAATLPAGTCTIWINARGGPVYVSVNGAAAAASSGTYVPEDNCRVLSFNNIASLQVWAATGDYAHLVYEG